MASSKSTNYSKMDLLVEDFTGSVSNEKAISVSKASTMIESFVALHQPTKHGLGAKEHERLCQLSDALKSSI